MRTIEASFSIWSSTMTPETVTSIVTATPDRVSVRGADRSPPRGLPKAHGWHITLNEKNEMFIENTLSRLIAKIVLMRDKIDLLRSADPSIELRFSLILSPSSDEFSLYISNSIIRNISDIGASVDIVFENMCADAINSQ
jgi:hypothetical protein